MKKMNKFNYILNEPATILQAMEKINSNSDGAVFVCDNDERVIGIITDGDIREQILKNTSTSDSI